MMNAETLRARIKESIDEAAGSDKFSEPVKHMITQICLEFYKIGWKECVRSQHKVMDEVAKTIFK